MRLRLSILLACLTSMLLAGSAQGVIGGQPDEAHPYVGLVQSPIGLCSGTLVSPTLFVTAAHCFPGDFSPALVRFGPALSPAVPGTFGVARVHPGFAPPLSGLPFTHDLAVVQLMAPVTMPAYGSLPARAVGSLGPRGRITAVGYGVSFFVRGEGPPAPAGAFERRAADIGVIPGRGPAGDTHLHLNPSGSDACFGDSGGPNFQVGTSTVLAVNSFASNRMCQGGYSYRLDSPAAMAFLGQFGG